MNDLQKQHLEAIIKDYTKSYKEIYKAGAKEHKTIMSTLPVYMMAQEAMCEAQDGYAYNHVVKSQLDKVRTRLQQLKDSLQAEVDICTQTNSPVGIIEHVYDPIRRIEAIETILFGDSDG